MVNIEMNDIYEGDKPYAFISYSHRDEIAMKKLKQVLLEHSIRYWYDNGLHSGDDWNLVIANHLQNAAVCLLLLSSNSASSEYVKNELNFAMNHRIPIHTLLLENFVLPADIEMMTGRRQMINLERGFDEKLLSSLPTELLSGDKAENKSESPDHPLYTIDELLFDRQGTKTYIGHHLKLGYKCIIQADEVSAIEKESVRDCITSAACIDHHVFPRIYDVLIGKTHVWTYQEYRNEQFLDEFLQQTEIDQKTILDWLFSVVDAMEYLFKKNYTLRDFSRGSITVISNNRIGIFRLQNIYYGVYRINQETRGYYFDVVLQEISILLAQLCLREPPVIPIRMIDTPHFDKQFLDRINLTIQKCTKVDGKTTYSDFMQIKEDIAKKRLSPSDKVLLRDRAKRLLEYEKEREKGKLIFTANADYSIRNVSFQNPERKFGYDETAILLPDDEIESGIMIKIQIMSTGQIFESSKDRIVVGKDKTYCDFIWTQPYICRTHCGIERISDAEYLVKDICATNHVYIKPPDEEMRMLRPNGECVVPVDTLVRLASSASEIKLIK